MMRIDVFFKKKIITIYLHLGGGARKGKEMGWAGSIYKGHWRRWKSRGGEGAMGVRDSHTPNPCPSFSSLPTTS
jgi:hypothetical protein